LNKSKPAQQTTKEQCWTMASGALVHKRK